MKIQSLVLSLAALAWGGAAAQSENAGSSGRQNCSAVSIKTCDIAHALRRGINMGNMLEAPNEGDWGVRLEPEYIPIVGKAFNTVRLPVRWSNHAAKTADARIEEAFAARVEAAVDAFLAQGVYVILNVHHYRQLSGDKVDWKEFEVEPSVVNERFINIWEQLSRRYAGKSHKLIFEIYNEPGAKLIGEPWNQLATQALQIIRRTNPDRVVMFGPVGNNPNFFSALKLPKDENLIVPVHSYIPFPFTHQGISYMPHFPKGVSCCSPAQRKQVNDQFDVISRWNSQSGYPIHLGEFGSVHNAEMGPRAEYARFLRQVAEERGIGWAYWELASDFGIYDPKAKAWRERLRSALLD